MEKETRNILQRATQDARRLLEDEYREQLEGTFDILLNGTIGKEAGLHLEAVQRLTRQKLVAAVEHNQASGITAAEAVAMYLREAAFTTLNRFAALKMLEARGLVQECISKAEHSAGFKEFGGLAPGLAALPDKGYRLYIESIFDEIGREVRVLFNRLDAASLLWPRRQAFNTLLEILNQQELASVWAEDETIGWVYQYFNSQEERRQMREESAAPRNSRELAVRNQFFTPRYVVEFLTDNTLGRIWYEMQQGRTALAQSCRYLVRRPDEVFLGPLTESAEDNREVFEAARLLQEGTEDTFPSFESKEDHIERLINLAHCVDGYVRHPLDGDDIWSWVADIEAQMLRPDSAKLVSAQALMDYLFLEARADRSGEGLGRAMLQSSCLRAANEIRERVLNSRRNDLSKEELLRMPVFIPHRLLKDPREIRLLDPACGSMHFGLYAFDLFETIYEEAWKTDASFREKFPGCWIKADSISVRNWDALTCYALGTRLTRENAMLVVQSLGSLDPPGRFHLYCPEKVEKQSGISYIRRLADMDWKSFLSEGWVTASAFRENALENIVCEEYSEEEALRNFRKLIPSLIIENNIHGIDIDRRAVQIAGLSLWLRAQRSWQAQGIKAKERPQIQKSNIVCAEPMPGERDMFEEFLKGLREDRLENLMRRALAIPPDRQVRATKAMADSLCALASTVWESMSLAGEAGSLLKIEDDIAQSVRKSRATWEDKSPLFRFTEFNLEGKTNDRYVKFLDGDANDFWKSAEHLLLVAMNEFAQRVSDERTVSRCLFADDAVHGFAFLNVCRKRYDVTLMNPPFGEPSEKTRQLFKKTYPSAADNVAVCFMIRGEEFLAPSGLTGSITDCSWAKKYDYGDFRTDVLQSANLRVLVHLGWEVLDDANVETNVVVRGGHSHLAFALNFGNLDHKDTALIIAVRDNPPQSFCRYLRFAQLPNSVFAFEMQGKEFKAYAVSDFLSVSFMRAVAGVKSCNSTADFRTWWETPEEELGDGRNWQLLHNGSPYCPFHYPAFFAVRSDKGLWTQLMANGGARPGEEYYSQPGIAFGKRTNTMYGYVKPRRQVFSQEGQALFPVSGVSIWGMLALVNSQVYARHANYVAGQHKYHNYLNKICLATDSIPIESIEAREAHLVLRSLDLANENTHLFVSPTTRPEFLLGCPHEVREKNAETLVARVRDLRIQIEKTLSLALDFDGDEDTIQNVDYYAHYFGESFSPHLVGSVWASFAVGCTYGRWDIRFATGEKRVNELSDPFAPLSNCPTGQLQAESGLPITQDDSNWNYPLVIPWEGILVDDPGHPLDIETRVHQSMQIIWKGHAETITHEFNEILGVNALRDYFRKPTCFFSDHIKRYSRSRRKAPIYWQLSTPSASYSVWLYYHRFTKDTFYKVLNDFVVPKVRHEERKLTSLVQEHGATPTSSQRKELAEQEGFVEELRGFRDEVARVAPLWNPNLNDGVIINFAPLWRLVPQHRAWQKECKDCWDKLVRGDYDWAHLAMHLWPERVVPKCAEDRSLAIAHGLDEVFWEEDEKGKGKPRKVSKEDMTRLIQERTSPSVKAALNELLSASAISTIKGGKKAYKRK